MEITGSNADDAMVGQLDNEIQRARVYAAYHEGRKDRCDGCRYVPFYKRMYPNAKSVFDAGAANCGVMRLLEAKGSAVSRSSSKHHRGALSPSSSSALSLRLSRAGPRMNLPFFLWGKMEPIFRGKLKCVE